MSYKTGGTGKGDKWRYGHNHNKISENMGKVKQTKKYDTIKEVKKSATKTTFVFDSY